MSEIVVGQDGLYRDGVKIKLEFGNDEQIAALRKHEKKMQSHTDGFEPIFSYEVKGHSYFSCLCGTIMSSEVDAVSEDDIDCFEGIEKECRSCKRKYVYVIEREYFIHSSGRKVIKHENLRVKLKK
jgi:hypothetical protein